MKKCKLFLILSFILCSLLMIPVNVAYAEQKEAEIDSSVNFGFLYDGTKVIDADITAGNATGYGVYEIDKSVTVKATANTGFKFVGWKITRPVVTTKGEETDEGYVEKEVITDVETTYIVSEFSDLEALIGLGFAVETKDNVGFDNYMDYGSLTFKVKDNLTIDPVFDYIYYDVEVSDKILEVANLTEETIGGNTVYYSKKIVDDKGTETDETDDVITYTNSVLNNNYYETLYYDETNKFYTIKETLLADEKGTNLQIVPVERGAYTYNQNLEIKFNINIDDNDVYSSTNVDVTKLLLNNENVTTSSINFGTENVENIKTNTITKGSFDRTKSFEFYLNVKDDNSLDINYDRLYIVDIKLSLDGVEYVNGKDDGRFRGDLKLEKPGQEDKKDEEKEYEKVIDLLLSGVALSESANVQRFYSVISNFDNANQTPKSMFVKAKDNFKIYANDISRTVKGHQYLYYETSDDWNTFEFNKYNTDNFATTVEIPYMETLYELDFKFVQNKKGSYSVLSDNIYNVLNTIEFKRGETFDLKSENAPANIGYTFTGYSESSSGSANGNETIVVPTDTPTNITRYMIYNLNEYTLVFDGYDDDLLTYVDKSGNPAKLPTLTAFKFNGQSLFNKGDSTISSTTISLGDRVNLTQEVNQGYDFQNYSLYKNGKEEYVVENRFAITQDIIKDYVDNNKLTLKINFTKTPYSLVYYADADHMATLEVDTKPSNAEVVEGYYDNTNGDFSNSLLASGIYHETENPNGKYYLGGDMSKCTAENKITVLVVRNLYRFQTIKFTATANEILDENKQGTGRNYSFDSVESNLTSLKFTVNQNSLTFDYSATNETLLRKKEAKIVLNCSIPYTSINIKINDANALDLVSAIKINNGNITIAESSSISVLSSKIDVGTECTVTIDINAINFGYVLSGYKIGENGTLQDYSIADGIKITIASEQKYEVYLEFGYINYKLNINLIDVDGNAENKTVVDADSTKDGINPFTLNLNDPASNLVVDFTMDNGKYISDARGKDGSKIDVMIGSNADLSTSYKFNIWTENSGLTYSEALKNFLALCNYDESNGTYSVDLTYAYHTYDVTLNIEFLSSDNLNNTYGSAIEWKIEKNKEDVTDTLTGDGWESRTFNVAYNDALTISATVPTGLDVKGIFRYGSTEITTGSAFNIIYNIENLNPGTEENRVFTLKVDYRVYTGSLTFNGGGNYGSASFNNGSTKAQIKIINDLIISTPENKNEGYRLEGIFTPCDYAESSDIFIITDEENGKIVNTIGKDFDANTTYYKRIDNNKKFNPSNFKIKDNGFSIKVLFTSIELKFSVNNLNVEEWENVKNNKEDLNSSIGPENFTTFKYFKKTVNTEYEEISSNAVLVAGDILKVEITFNEIELNNAKYDLSYGMSLKSVEAYFADKLVSGLGYWDGDKVYFECEVGTLFKSLPAGEDTIKFDLGYSVKKVPIKLTSNVILDQDGKSLIGAELSFGNNSSVPFEITEGGIIINDIYFLQSLQSIFNLKETAKFLKIDNVQLYLSGSKIEDLSKYNITNTDNKISLRAYNDKIIKSDELITLKAMVSPKFEYSVNKNDDGSYLFSKIYKFIVDTNNNEIKGIGQSVSKGKTGADIMSEKIVTDIMTITYFDEYGMEIEFPSEVGKYSIKISFNANSWLANAQCPDNLMLEIKPYVLNLVSSYAGLYEKTYNAKKSVTDRNEFLRHIKSVVDGKQYDGSLFVNFGLDVKMETESANASDLAYDLIISNYTARRNFALPEKSQVVMKSAVKINRIKLSLQGVQVRDKVFDGTTTATLEQGMKLNGIINNENVNLDLDALQPSFLNVDIGEEKEITVNKFAFFGDVDKIGNYEIDEIYYVRRGNIYPSSLSVTIDGVGVVQVINERGKTDHELASLIPVDAKLHVTVFSSEDDTYKTVFKRISKFLTRTRVLKIGYQISIESEGKVQGLNNNLTVKVPSIKNMTALVAVTDNEGVKADVKREDFMLNVDLLDVDAEVDYLVLVQKRTLFKAWQIAVIVVSIVAVMAGVVVALVILRKKKLNRYEMNDVI
ncbi:MAG: hypothetical protein E7374_01050 [Clostridiales bacterium]|nr:hypothetical protein [Clostridiales bacterium]